MILSSALYGDHYPFKEMGLFDDYNVVIDPEDLKENSCLVVWGGGDISPTLYDRPVGNRTWASEKLSDRDTHEWNLMSRAYEMGLPIIGICRGAQMLCALAGGFLIQDVTDHGQAHKVETKEGLKFKVSSLHHQMLYPFEVDHEMVAWSKTNLSQHYLDVNTPINMPREPEFVYFPKQRGIAIQWHPEYMEVGCAANQYVQQKVKEYL